MTTFEEEAYPDGLEDPGAVLSGEQLDALAGLSPAIDPPPPVLGVEDQPDPAAHRAPPGPRPDDGPQDVEAVKP